VATSETRYRFVLGSKHGGRFPPLVIVGRQFPQSRLTLGTLLHMVHPRIVFDVMIIGSRQSLQPLVITLHDIAVHFRASYSLTNSLMRAITRLRLT
jgi:hypothetical protein